MSNETGKVRVGRVVANKMDKTAVVAVRWERRHPLYRKSMRRITKFYAHDPQNECKLGDLVRIQETRPLSRTKHWRVLDIMERREVAEVRPVDLDPVDINGTTTTEEPETVEPEEEGQEEEETE
jgi:small subunit ribosomal protein S17